MLRAATYCYFLVGMLVLVFGLAPYTGTAMPQASLFAPVHLLEEALYADGTLRPDVRGSFDGRQFRLTTASDGRPIFLPAQTYGVGDERWLDSFGAPNGASAEVLAVLRVGPFLYVAGRFAAVGNTAARSVIRWDGTQWSSLGSGVNGDVYCLAAGSGGELYVGGTFTQAGGIQADNVARWNGSNWSALGAGLQNFNMPYSRVHALAVDGAGQVYAGGSFNQSGSNLDMQNIARWDGSTWNRLGIPGVNGLGGTVRALAWGTGGELYAGGQFNRAGAVTANGVARWNGTTWTALGTGVDNSVLALAVDANGNLYAGGTFTRAASLTANRVARWNGSAWSALVNNPATGQGNGVNEEVRALTLGAGGELYVGGRFTQAGTSSASRVARWTGSAWTPLASGLGATAAEHVNTVQVAASGDLYAGGLFDRTGTVNVECLAQWRGTAWEPPAGTSAARGLSGSIYAVAVAPNGDVYVGGLMNFAGSTAARSVARWDGSSWQALGTGLTSTSLQVGTAAVYAFAFAPNGDVYAGGVFDRAGSTATNYIARWNGTAWLPLGTGLAHTSLITYVSALAVAPNGDLYVGGSFNRAGGQPANGVARWNGSTWSALGAGVDGVVNDLALAPSGELYAAGAFTTAGGMSAWGIARWDGTQWNALGAGLQNPGGTIGRGYSVTLVPGGGIYVAGDFTLVNGVPSNRVARWDGAAWFPLGAGLGGPSSTNEVVQSLTLAPNGELYAGGNFAVSGSSPVANVARWDGTRWNALGTGLDNSVWQMSHDASGKLYAVGVFSTTGDGSKAVCGFGIYDPARPLASSIARKVAGLQIFPNPAHGAVMLQLDDDVFRGPIIIRDANGRVVRRYSALQERRMTLDMQGLPVGTYLIQVGDLFRRVVLE